MTAFPSYSTGTIAIGANAIVGIGTGTAWSGVNARPGDMLYCAGHYVLIPDVTDLTHIVLEPWPHAVVPAGTAYKIIQCSPMRFAGAQAMADVSAMLSYLNSLGPIINVQTGGVPDPSIGSDGMYAHRMIDDQWWLKAGGVWGLSVSPASSFTQIGTGAVSRSVFNKLKETFSVTDFGTVGTIDDTAVFNLAIAAAVAAGTVGLIKVPGGNYNLLNGITIPDNITLEGAGEGITNLIAWHTDVTVVTVAGSRGGLKNLSIYGKGTNNDTGTFGAVNAALIVSGHINLIENVNVNGGSFPFYVTGSDNKFEHVTASYAYGTANVAENGPNWYIRCIFNHLTSGIALTDAFPGALWSPSQVVSVGRVRQVSVGGTLYSIVCSVAGTTSLIAPTLKNYGINIPDGTATWLLLGQAALCAIAPGPGSGETHFVLCDTTGTYLAAINMTGGVVTYSNSVVAGKFNISGTAGMLMLHSNELGGDINILAGFTGWVSIQANLGFIGTLVNVNVAANVNNFIIAGNMFNGGVITVAAGTSDHYRIYGNPNSTTVDGGTGTDKADIEIGAILSKSPTGGIGYAPGAGGIVTESAVSAAVTINKMSGIITMFASAIPAAGVTGFFVNNTNFVVGDGVIINLIDGAASVAAYIIQAGLMTNGQFGIFIFNRSGGTLTEPLRIAFNIIKGAHT